MTHKPRETLTKVERDALREVNADKDIVIVPADKGRSTVVPDRKDYPQKAKNLLDDRQFYIPCETNPIKTLTREINARLLALENLGAITATDRRMASAQETALARFYGLPKLHKEGAPLRPIVSLKGTPTYGLARWLFRRLKFLTADSDTTVCSSTQFLEKLKGILKFCLRTYFTFDGTIYEQVKGTPMGSPISGFIVEAVLQRLESLVFQHHRPKSWARYVDDTFVVIERDQVLTFKERLNSVFADIQFTMEEEKNNQLAFLYVLVCRKDCGGLKTKVFRKATNTMQILIFNSNHPICHKRSCILHKRDVVTSDWPRRTISSPEVNAIKELKRDEDIVIVPADKGRATVILDKSEYAAKAQELLNDNQSYKVIDSDPMKTLVAKISKSLSLMRNQQAIYPQTKRPLTANCGAEGHTYLRLAKWLTKHLKKLTEGSEHTAVSPSHLQERLRGVKIAPNEIMVSFDVVSLLTFIPKELATRVISDLLERRYDEEEKPLKRKHIMELLDYCLSTYFTFNGQVYEQIQGTPMGSPISGYLAEAVLQKLETRVFQSYMPTFWMRYVDDTFVILPQDMKESFRSKLNSIFPQIQFTMEEEKDGEIPFLDVQVSRQEDGALQTGVFRKTTDTAKILHYSSNHPWHINAVACGHSSYISTHCSTEAEKLRERKSLWRLVLSNGYPRSFINKCLYQRHMKTDGEQKQKPEFFRALPYMSDVSEATERMLRPLNVGLGHRPEVTIRRLLMRPKGRLPPEDTSGIVYRINCLDCPANYCGMTDKRLRSRMHEHSLAVKRKDVRSHVAMHSLENDHQFGFDKAEVIGRAENKMAREIIEAWQSKANSINRRIDLPAPYEAVRHHLKGGPMGKENNTPMSTE
nr:unnamed protein product [Spirometra erinaceieuropaei]